MKDLIVEGVSVPDLNSSDEFISTLQQCYETISSSPSRYTGLIYVASHKVTAVDTQARNSNLIAETLGNSDAQDRFTTGIIRCATPVFEKGAYRGVLIVDIDWLQIMKLVNDFKFGQFGYAYLQEATGQVADVVEDSPEAPLSNTLPDGTQIVSGEIIKNANLGLVIAHPQHNYVGWMDFSSSGIPNITNLSSMQDAGDSGIYQYIYDGSLRWTAYAPVAFNSSRIININNWSAAATLPTYEIIQPADVIEEEIQAKIALANAQIKLKTESLGPENAIIFTAVITAIIASIIAALVARRLQRQTALEMEKAVLQANNIELEQLAQERQIAEEEARQERDRAQNYLNMAGVIMLALDLSGNVTMINRKGAEILGYAEKEILDKNWFDNFIPPQSRTEAKEDFNTMLSASAGGEFHEAALVTSTGEERTILWQDIPVHDADGFVNGILSSGEDVTDKKKAEAEKRMIEQKALVNMRLATVGEMASGIAHEINNPLTAVIGFSELLMNADIPKDLEEDVSLIYEGSKRVSSIISRLLAFARQQKPKHDLIDINEVISTTLELRKYHLSTSNIVVECNLAADIPPTMADGGQLQQVFLNLILNAEQAMWEANKMGSLSICSRLEDDTIKVSVKDDGPGIPPAIKPQIFDPFFTTKDVGKGTGLGLSVCLGIISEHGGKLIVQSEQGKGAEFIIELPVIKTEQPATVDRKIAVPAPNWFRADIGSG